MAAEIASVITAIGYMPTLTYNASKQTISISLEDFDFKFLTDDELRSITWTGTSYDKNTESTSIIHNAENPFASFIDLQPIRNIYIKSPNLGNVNTIGSRGECDIIKKVPATADFNQMIFDNSLITNDFLDCSRLTLRTIEFRLTDAAGNDIPFHGSY